MGNNERFEDLMSDINNIGKSYGFKNGIDWAVSAQQAGEISYYDYKKYEICHRLRVPYSHGAARDIYISNQTYNDAKHFFNDIRSSRLRKRFNTPRLPKGTFRANSYTKEFSWNGNNNTKYYFRFEIVQEYQKRVYDDGTRFEGYGYTIYVKEAPYKEWCIKHNREYEFHYYTLPENNPSICWNRLITNFSDANAVMVTWANRYKTILERLFQNKTIDVSKLNKSSYRRGILPTGTFRAHNKHHKKQNLKTIHISRSVYNEILNTLGTRKPELGGMLGWKEDQDYIDTFVFDKYAKVGFSEYSPNTEYLMDVMEHEWRENSIYLGGFIHSHPQDFCKLSNADVEYAQRIMEAFDMRYIFMPIVTSSYEYEARIYPYIVNRQGNVSECKIVIFNDTISTDMIDIDPIKMAEINSQFDKMSGINPVREQECTPVLEQNETFSRISSVINIEHMKQCSVIGIGCGGARGFYEDMARIGVGHFYLMDGDISSKSNIASQNGYLSEVGKAKVEVVKNRLLDIDDTIDVNTYQCMLDDSISDAWFKNNIVDKIIPYKTILCAFTDDFWAQARTQELAIKYNIPYLSAQHHQYGETSEVFYWYPNISKYTADEVFADRYDAYRNGYINTVTSEGSPIFNTTRLNALCEKIATGILMFSYDIQSDYCSFLKFQSDKNLLLVRQKSLINSNSSLKDLFANDSCFFDDVDWVDVSLFVEE